LKLFEASTDALRASTDALRASTDALRSINPEKHPERPLSIYPSTAPAAAGAGMVGQPEPFCGAANVVVVVACSLSFDSFGDDFWHFLL